MAQGLPHFQTDLGPVLRALPGETTPERRLLDLEHSVHAVEEAAAGPEVLFFTENGFYSTETCVRWNSLCLNIVY